MEFFNKARVVKLRSHLDKYLVADEDEETVRQSRNGSSSKARWVIEFVDGKNDSLRLKSCYNRYLTASDEPFLLGVTGKKVLQTIPSNKNDTCIEWEPIKEGFRLKLRTKASGKFLRANWGTPPWRNSVTHDLPHRTATQDWVLWEVDVVDISISEAEPLSSYGSSISSNSRSSSIVSESDVSVRSSISSNTRSPSIFSDRSSFSSKSQDDFSASKARSLSIQIRGKQSGMEFFNKAKAVRLKSYFGKYIVADEDEETVRQSRNGSSHKARWTVEFVEGKNNTIRLKSFHGGRYLTASDEPFLLGLTGKKILQTAPAKNQTKNSDSIEWEPIKEGFKLLLRTQEGKFLRANGGTPPWRNTVTHDIPHRTATQDWVLWEVDVVDISVSNISYSLSRNISSASTFSSSVDDFAGSPDTGSPLVGKQSGMELFQKAKSVRLRSHHDKYLSADDDQESVFQDRNGSVKRAKWTVEFVDGIENVIRLKSCYGKYLTATDEQFLLGVTGRKVIQSMPRKLDSKVEWEPIREGVQVRLKTRYGNYLRANGGLPPLRNSITHDIPQRHTDWILWEVDVIEIRSQPSPQPPPRSDSLSSSEPCSPSFNLRSPRSSKFESSESFGSSPAKSEGRIIYYSVADDNGKIEEGREEPCFNFKGHDLEELNEKLEEETGLEDLIVCLRNPLNGKLYPLRLDLPPNKANMHIVVVPSSSRAARDFAPETTPSI